MGRLQGKVAIVTGAAGGFGEGIARRVVAEDAKGLLADLDVAKADDASRFITGVELPVDGGRTI